MHNPKANAAAAEIILDTLAIQRTHMAWLINNAAADQNLDNVEIWNAVTAIIANLELDRRRSEKAVTHGGE